MGDQKIMKTKQDDTKYYMHYVSGDVQTLEQWQAEDYTAEWTADQEAKKDAFLEHHEAAEWTDEPAPTQAEIIQHYIDLGYLIEVRKAKTAAEKAEYGEWMDTDK